MVGRFPSLQTPNVVEETHLYRPRLTLNIGMTMDYRINMIWGIQIDGYFTSTKIFFQYHSIDTKTYDYVDTYIEATKRN